MRQVASVAVITNPAESLQGKAIVDYIQSISPRVISRDRFKDLLPLTATLEEVPLAGLRIGKIKPERIASYATQESKTAPPVVIRLTKRGPLVVDGRHRSTVARQQGQTHIRAYVARPQEK